MTHKLIKTENYLLVVDDSWIEVGDYYWNKEYPSQVYKRHHYNTSSDYKKIIAHLPLNGSPILEGVDLLPPIEDDEALIEDALSDLPKNLNKTNVYGLGFIDGRISGYNKSLKKYKYTEKDMVMAIDMARDVDVKDGLTDYKYSIKDILEYHSDYPIYFECSTEWVNRKGKKSEDFTDVALYDENTKQFDAVIIHKTITTAQGVQWVGKYK
jgi:hypothetical protein